MTDLITGIARVPGQLVSIFPGSHPGTVQQDFRGREWAMSHFAETLSNQERRRDSQAVTDISAPSGELYSPGPDEYVREHPGIIQSSNAVTNETVANLSESRSVDGAQFTRGQTAVKKGEEKSYGKRRRRARKVLSETRYHAAKSAKHALNFVLVLPTDFTLSLSKGFHNAPKLYHDDTVEPMPKVIGIKSGFRAAGKEFYHGLYNGLTGLVTLPSRGFRQSGGEGMVKGIGKGVGGVFFKPTAGLFGLAGLPLDGLHKCVRGSLSKIKSKEIIRLRITQGIEEMCAASNEEQNMVIRKWHELQQDGLTQEGH
jgi:hypothetical protein